MRDERGYLAAYDNVAEMSVLLVIQNRGRPTFNASLREAIKAGYVFKTGPNPKDPTESYASLTQRGSDLALGKGWLVRCGYELGSEECQVLVYTDDEHCLSCKRTIARHRAEDIWSLDILHLSEDADDHGLFWLDDQHYSGNEDGEIHHHIHGVDGLSCFGDFTEDRDYRYEDKADIVIVDLPYCIYPCHETVTQRRDYNIALLSTYP